jgi:hypothetical protein
MNSLSSTVEKTGRYGFLLLCLCLMIGLKPFLTDFIERDLLTDIFLICVLVSGIYALDRDPVALRISCVLAFSVIILKMLSRLSIPLHLLELVLTDLFFAQVLSMILHHILIEQEVTYDTVMGGACAFVLIGFLWAYAYYILETLEPNSLKGSQPLSQEPSDYIYFSFVTLTSVGYGDILPISQKAHSLAILEAIIGQLYLTIMVSRLVSLHISGSQHG